MKIMIIIREMLICLCLVFFPVHGFAESTGNAADPAMPTEAERALGTVLEFSRSLLETPKDVRTSARYTGIQQVRGENCYMFIVYAHLPDRYENLGEYAVEQGGTHVYRYDVVEDAYCLVHPGTPDQAEEAVLLCRNAPAIVSAVAEELWPVREHQERFCTPGKDMQWEGRTGHLVELSARYPSGRQELGNIVYFGDGTDQLYHLDRISGALVKISVANVMVLDEPNGFSGVLNKAVPLMDTAWAVPKGWQRLYGYAGTRSVQGVDCWIVNVLNENPEGAFDRENVAVLALAPDGGMWTFDGNKGLYARFGANRSSQARF